MKKFYLHNGTEQTGPFDIGELKTKNINQDTPVWYEGLANWTTAGKIDELKILFQAVPPPPFIKQTVPPIKKEATTQPNSQPQTQKKNNSGMIAGTVTGIALFLVCGFFILTKMKQGGGSSTNNASADTYQEKVMTIEEIELSEPTNFLSASGTYKENFWGDKFKVSCKITNNATVATYKDAVVMVIYYSKTKTILASNKYTIYEVFPPHSTKTVELKIDNYKNVSTIGWDVIKAESY